ncbi:MAG: hypothetical protein KKA07_05075 [Bacteroidetes bacterium]|nr:hypothetical protein [Bacteroidota bacterium]MBU1718425.1 hypothetical protein [Bacteroidota bacterium]
MKKLALFLILVMSTSLFTIAQDKIELDRVPEPVKTTFNEKYNGAVKQKWTKEKKSYNVKFLLNKCKGNASFNDDGKWTGGTLKIKKLTDLPQEVQDGFTKSEFGVWGIREIFVQENGYEKLYYFGVKTKGQPLRYISFKENGEQKGK